VAFTGKQMHTNSWRRNHWESRKTAKIGTQLKDYLHSLQGQQINIKLFKV